MAKRVIVAGVLGAVALMVWTLVSNGIFGFNARLRMNSVQNGRGAFICNWNPYITAVLIEYRCSLSQSIGRNR
jgi:hypothetical protein